MPKAGLEPARVSPLPPQDSVSTMFHHFGTQNICVGKNSGRFLPSADFFVNLKKRAADSYGLPSRDKELFYLWLYFWGAAGVFAAGASGITGCCTGAGGNVFSASERETPSSKDFAL